MVLADTETVYGFLFKIARKFKWYFLFQATLATFWAMDLSIRPYYMKVIVDIIAECRPEDISSSIWYPCLMYLCMSALTIFVLRMYDWLRMVLIPPLKKHIGLVFMGRLMNHSQSMYHNTQIGNLSNKVTDVVDGIPELFCIMIEQVWAYLLAICFALYTVSLVGIKFAIALFVFVVAFITCSVMFSLHTKKLSIKAAESKSNVIGHIADIISNLISVKIFLGKKKEEAFLEKTMDHFVQASQARDWFVLKFYTFQAAAYILFQGISLVWLIKGFQQKTITAGDFVLITSLNTTMLDTLWSITQQFSDFSQKLGTTLQGLRVLLLPVQIEDKSSAYQLPATTGAIAFENVSFQYQDSSFAISDLSLTIPAGQHVGVVGYSGSGKTTFINLMLRLFDIDGGAITIDGHKIGDVTQDSLRQAFSVIPQDSLLFHRTLLENIRYGTSDATQEEIVQAAQKAQIHQTIMEMPEGYNTVVGERGSKLSGGQRQRIAIARALLKQAPILILDETTSQLDVLTEKQIQAALSELMIGKTTIFITHRLSMLKRLDRILVFENGNIVQDGTHDQLIAVPGIYASLWGQ